MPDNYLESLMSNYHKYKDPQRPPALEDVQKLQIAIKQVEGRFDALLRLITSFAQAPSLEEMLRILVVHGQVLLPFEAIELMKLDESGERLLLYSMCYEGRIKWDIVMNIKGTEMESMVNERRISLVGNVHEEPDFPVSDVVHIYNIHSIMQVPMSSGDEFLGFLCYYHRKPDVFRQNFLELAGFFSSLVGMTLENILLREKCQFHQAPSMEKGEPDYSLSLFLREELKPLQDKIVERCQGFSEKSAGKMTTKQQDLVKEIREFAETEQRKLEHLNEYLLLSGGQVYLDRRKADIGRAINDSLDKLKSRIDDKGLRILLEVDKKFPQVVADYKKLQRILIALIENAIEASKAGNLLRINVALEGSDAVVGISDFGDPINPKDFENILTPFGKIEYTSTPKRGKLILNMPVVKMLVTLSGGKIWIESDNEETTFLFTLPVVK